MADNRLAAFSWVSVHRDIMGDQFYDEGKFFASNVPYLLIQSFLIITLLLEE